MAKRGTERRIRGLHRECGTVVTKVKAILTSSPLLAYEVRNKMGPVHVVYSARLGLPLRSRVMGATGRIPAVITIDRQCHRATRSRTLPSARGSDVRRGGGCRGGEGVAQLRRGKVRVLCMTRGGNRVSLGSLVRGLNREGVSDVLLRKNKVLG